MSVFNGEQYLKYAVDSILSQTFTDFEFIIVNDGSTDNSLKILEGYSDERIQIIDNESNIGLTKSLNRALSHASGQYIARQDADDISLINRIEQQVIFFKNNPDAVLIGTGCDFIDKNNSIISKISTLTNPEKRMIEQNCFVHGSVMFRKDIINTVGVYNEIFRYAQDYDFWLRILKRYQISYLNIELYQLRLHDGCIGVNKRREQLLYSLLARKFFRDEIDNALIENIKLDINNLYNTLNNNELLFFHKAMMYHYMRLDNKKMFNSECLTIIKLKPFDAKNILYFAWIIFGMRISKRFFSSQGMLR